MEGGVEAGGRVEGRDGGREGREGSGARREVRHCDRLGEGRGPGGMHGTV